MNVKLDGLDRSKAVEELTTTFYEIMVRNYKVNGGYILFYEQNFTSNRNLYFLMAMIFKTI